MATKLIGSCLAAISMYTRIPAWRLMTLDTEHYRSAVSWLPMVGFITGGTMALSFYVSYAVLSLPLLSSLILGVSSRLVLTGAFHEDGLGDFFDGFGSGRDKESILRIMKDSHVGSYAVIGYIIYYLLLFSLLMALPLHYIPWVMIVADVLGKCTGVGQIALLPYARREEESKTSVVYTHNQYLLVLPLILVIVFMYYVGLTTAWSLVIALPCLLFLWCSYLRKKIGGYTGDTCGALILLAELTVILIFVCTLKA